jgi:N-acetyl-anhydromuramyl-L-alanine amidase AmpD
LLSVTSGATTASSPKIVVYKSPNHEARPGGIRDVSLVVIHHTTGNSFAQTKATFMNGRTSNPVSAHFVIDKKGELYQFVDPNQRAYHAGVSAWKVKNNRGKLVLRENVNDYSIGVEFVNRGDGIDAFTKEQYAAFNALFDFLKANYPKLETKTASEVQKNIVGHKDITCRKIDPASNFDWKKIGVDRKELEKTRGPKAYCLTK